VPLTPLQRVLRGYFAYHAVPTNLKRLNGFRGEVGRLGAMLCFAGVSVPAQLGTLQSTYPQVLPALPGSASRSGGTLLRVTTLGKSRMR
jgi:hypothetical protein